jgi:hypothetical protein
MSTLTAPTAEPATYVPFTAETWRDPYPLYRQLREQDPVHHAPVGAWVLTRFADVFEAARDTATYSSASGLTFVNEIEELGGQLRTMVMMDPPDHTVHRRSVSPDFTARKVRALESSARSFVQARLGELVDAGGGDFVAGLARRLPAAIVGDYLGVPLADRERFEAWTVSLVQAGASGHMTDAQEALVDLYGYFSTLVDKRKDEPGPDMLSAAMRNAPQLSALDVLGMAFVMIAGGNDTATGLLAGATELLTAYPEQRQRLIDDPELIPGAVEEMLRLTSPVQGLCRTVTKDVTLHGKTVPAGDRVLLCYGAANRDPREFGRSAEEFDVTRRIPRMLTFSVGAHYCLGAHAARLEGRVVVEELLRTCPDFSVDAAAGRFAEGAFTRRYDYLPFSP